MTNQIRGVSGEDHLRLPSEAEVIFTVFVERVTPTTEIRGRLMGPRCIDTNTVEVAYHLRPLPPEEGATTLKARAIIPEASFWDPQRPFTYRTKIELWEDGKRCDSPAWFDTGFKAVSLGPRGFRLNGLPWTLKGTTRLPESEEDARQLRHEEYNLILAPASNPPIWFTANQFGFLVLGHVPLTYEDVTLSGVGAANISGFAWVLDQGQVATVSKIDEFITILRRRNQLVGVELTRELTGPLPPSLDFVVCPAALAASAGTLPKIIKGKTVEGSDLPGVIGWIDS